MIDFSEFCYDGSSTSETEKTRSKYFCDSKNESPEKTSLENYKSKKEVPPSTETDNSIGKVKETDDSNEKKDEEYVVPRKVFKKTEDPRHPLFRYTIPKNHTNNVIEEFVFIPPKET